MTTLKDDDPEQHPRRHHHPLDPLTVDEIRAAAEAVKDHHHHHHHHHKSFAAAAPEDEGEEEEATRRGLLRFVAISLKEPSRLSCSDDKGEQGNKRGRAAEVVVLNPATGLAYEYLVDLLLSGDDKNAAVVHSVVQVEKGRQPLLTPDDCDLAESIVQSSVEMQRIVLERYGIQDMKRIACDPWSVHLADETDRDKLVNWRSKHDTEGGDNGDVPGRLVQTFLYHRQYGDDENLQDNHYAHPIDIVPVVDLNARKIVTIHGLLDDRTTPAPMQVVPTIPSSSVQYHRDLLTTNSYLQTTWRHDVLRALHVVQPDGPSFTVVSSDQGEGGNLVAWQGWTFRVGFNYREGLVLHDVSYQGRSILKRGSLVEMAVPYADPYPPFQRKCAFDVGDYGLGYCANSLELGCDCLGNIHYFDAVLCNSKGEAVVKKKAVCMHEEDSGILFKHVEYRNGHNEARRGRELIISSIATVVNYEYLFYWHLRQDGCLDFKIKLSGELSTNQLSASEVIMQNNGIGQPTHGVMVAPGVNAQIHQHMFCARLDMAVDSAKNTVSEIDILPAQAAGSGPTAGSNPYGNAFEIHETILSTEQEAIRTYDASKARCWKISNADGKTNPITGKAVAYKLYPFTSGPAGPTVLTHADSAVSRKGAFATANLWVTPYCETERFPAGEYTPQGDGSAGLPHWTAKNRSILGQDLVLWHAFGVTHLPRPEDFPVMPCEVTGFTLKPDGFFAGNPAIDLPPVVDEASCCEQQVELVPQNGCCSKK